MVGAPVKHPHLNILKNFCKTFGPTQQLIKNQTMQRETLNTSIINDRRLSKCYDKFSQSGNLNVSLLDHLLVYFTRKAKGKY